MICDKKLKISIHKALASLDGKAPCWRWRYSRFQSTRLSRASTGKALLDFDFECISIHKALASLDQVAAINTAIHIIFQSTRLSRASTKQKYTTDLKIFDFNPQGSREPRQEQWEECMEHVPFQSTRLSRASTAKMHNYSCIYATFTCFILYIFYKSFFKLKFPRVI